MSTTGPALRPYELVAHNTAVASENRIHDDEVARRFGFAGGLVPGVDVYAYLTHPIVEAWGREWLTHGRAEVRFMVPVYDGHLTVIEPGLVEDDTVTVRALDDTGTECAVAVFTRGESTPVDEADGWPAASTPDSRPDATPEAFGAYEAAGSLPSHHHTLDPATADHYLDGVRESLPLFRAGEAPAHPAWLLRRANDALSGAVRLGPWIHVGSTIHHRDITAVGDTVETRSKVVRWWESKGHAFVNIDVALVVDGSVRTTIDHTAIYRPRVV